ncbi:MAG: hypothetical protein OXU40_03405 [Nitrospira sp.]|nr:hypothetical protein [Nitrospira sp.]
MPTDRDTFQYHFKLGNKIVRAGITYDLDRREAEHRSEPGWHKGHIKQVGFRTTSENAMRWEREQAEQGKPVDPDRLAGVLHRVSSPSVAGKRKRVL